MSKNTNTPSTTPAVIDLSLTMRGDITSESQLADYVDAFRESVKGDGRVSYGRTVVYMAARDFGGKDFVGADFAASVGVSPAYVSTLAGLALAVERNITPHGTDIMARRWAALVQNMTKDVRAALKSKAFTLKALDAILFTTADAKQAKRKDDTAKRVENATEPSEGGVTEPATLTVEDAITALDQAAAFLALSTLTPAQVEKVEEIISSLGARLPVAA